MKKKLEADLISIAHRILQLKNKSDINQLYLETQKLYEKLSVLRFVDEHFSEVKPTIGLTEIEKKIEEVFDQKEATQSKKNTAIEETTAETTAETKIETPIEHTVGTTGILQPTPTILPEEIASEDTIETPLAEKEEKIPEEKTAAEKEILEEKEPISEVAVAAQEETTVIEEIATPETTPFTPAFELSKEEDVEEVLEEKVAETEAPKKTEAVQISFEDLLGGNYSDAQFVKVHPLENIPTTIAIDFEEKKLDTIEEAKPERAEPKTASLNEKLAKNIHIDLNDRIAFTKHLFGNSSEDYNRVLNQLITFDTFYETRDFIQEMVKPDYNNWEGKQDYEERFMDIIEKKFL